MTSLASLPSDVLKLILAQLNLRMLAMMQQLGTLIP